MNKGLLAFWLVLPLGAWAYHEGPGQDGLTLDKVDLLVREAHTFAEAERWTDAVEKYDEALVELPSDLVEESWRIRLERDKARMLSAKLPAAHRDLQDLVGEMLEDGTADPDLFDETRAALASSQYYLTWLMRLEGLPREEWEPEIEAARQTYRLLAERAQESGNDEQKAQRLEDLESAIRLARMELTELQGLPLPNQ